MFDLFGISAFGTYESRKVDRNDFEWGFVSTARNTDNDHNPFETAVRHKEYGDRAGGNAVVVEEYKTVEEAREGHKRWVEKMTSDPLPDELVEVGTSHICELIDAFGFDKGRYPRKAAK